MEAGKVKLGPRNRDRDLYFVGDGLVDEVGAIGRDLSILAHCNHTIESHGSYSFFAGEGLFSMSQDRLYIMPNMSPQKH